MRIIIFGDPHIKEKAIPELEIIFAEILEQEGDVLVMIGDYYDNKHPNAQEIFFGTKWAFKFKKRFKKIIFLRGNHDRTKKISAIEYLKYFKIRVVDEYIDTWNNYYGHFMTNKSLYEYGTYQKTIKQLNKYSLVLLGHQHNPQDLLANRMYHLGSIRYCHFNEVTDPYKQIAVIEEGNIKFIKLNSPIPMIDVKSISEVTKQKDRNCKIRLVISSFAQFKEEVNQIAQYKDKFVEFKVKLDFTPIEATCKREKGWIIDAFGNKKIIYYPNKPIQKRSLSDILREGIAKIEDADVKNLLQEQLEEI